MAVTPNSNEAFLREVDEELRRDQAVDFWRRYGRWLIVAVAVGLAAFAGFLYWQHRQGQIAAEQATALQGVYDALGAGRAADTVKPLAGLSASKIDGYRALALFTQADLLLQKQDQKGAAAKFAQVAGDSSASPVFRDLALIRQTAAEFDSLKPEVVVARLRTLAVPGNPWFGSAGELVAAAYVRQGRSDLAGQLFGKVANGQDVPQTLRRRAGEMAGVLGVDAVVDEESKASK